MQFSSVCIVQKLTKVHPNVLNYAVCPQKFKNKILESENVTVKIMPNSVLNSRT